MINQILIGDAKDIEIAKLKTQIQHFKAYDEKRKRYYSDKMQRLGELESYVLELEQMDKGPMIQHLKKEIKQLNRVIMMHHISRTLTSEELSENIPIIQLKAERKNLMEKINLLKSTIQMLRNDNIDLRKRLGYSVDCNGNS